MKTPLGTEVDLSPSSSSCSRSRRGPLRHSCAMATKNSPGHIVLDGVPALRERGTAAPHLFGTCLLWPRSPISATAELLSRNCIIHKNCPWIGDPRSPRNCTHGGLCASETYTTKDETLTQCSRRPLNYIDSVSLNEAGLGYCSSFHVCNRHKMLLSLYHVTNKNAYTSYFYSILYLIPITMSYNQLINHCLVNTVTIKDRPLQRWHLCATACYFEIM